MYAKARSTGSWQLLLRNAVFDLRFEAGGNGMTREALLLCLRIGKNGASIARQKTEGTKDQGPVSRKRLPLEPHALFTFNRFSCTLLNKKRISCLFRDGCLTRELCSKST